MTTFGPMVRRSAKAGGVLLAVGSVQFVLGMAIAQLLWKGSFSLSQNYISDLGGPDAAAAWVFNDSVRILGLCAIAGGYLLYRAFAPKTFSRLGVAMLLLAGLGAIAVGTFPEQSPELGGNIHALASLTAFLGGGLALAFLAVAMLRDTRWDGYRLFTMLCGLVTLTAIALLVSGRYAGLGPGGMERLVAAPILLWGALVGVHLQRIATYHPDTPTAPPIYGAE
ncbi:MAG: DUF998 domain-containing protein [Thermoplasmata archaeon]|nr:DUF998 domain-containing protein [Thermoplasmata archaeon]